MSMYVLFNLSNKLELLEITLNLIGTLCVSLSVHIPSYYGVIFLFVSLGGILITGGLLVIKMYFLSSLPQEIPWLKIELSYFAVWTLFCVIGASLAAYVGQHDDAFLAGSVFMYLNMMVYGYGAFLRFNVAF